MDTTGGIGKYVRLIKSADSARNRRNFLQRCIEEKVIPQSIPFKTKTSQHIFPEYIETYMQHTVKTLKHQESTTRHTANLLKTRLIKNKQLDATTLNDIHTKTHAISKKQVSTQNRKLSSLCTNSRWTKIGNKNLIHNISNYTPTPTELEALSLGLKFATGLRNNNTTDLIQRNYRQSDSEFTKGFIQGILSTTSLNPSLNQTLIPKRYVTALSQLKHNNEIHITPSDKGGGIVIMNSVDYLTKMDTLLQDTNVYSPTNLTAIEKSTKDFISKFKQLTDKSWHNLIEYHPKIPTLYGLPKTHKPNVPLRPITSAIGSTPHRIAKAISKILTPLLGTISPSHIRHSGHLLEQIRNINTNDMLLASLDVESLYTNIPVDKCLEALRDHLKKTKPTLPIPVDTLIDICTLCCQMNFFHFNNKFYVQRFGLPMGNPISCAIACLYLELLESGPFQYILPKNSHYYRYIDDALFIYPQNTNLPDLIRRLNDIEPTINFTNEKELNNCLPYLDIMIHRSTPHLSFEVFRKPTYKNDLINFHSQHSNHVKTGMIIGSYLRALRICSDEYLSKEESFILESFKNLKYPQHFILHARKKAYTIFKSNRTPNTNPNPRPVFLPSNSITNTLVSQSIDPDMKFITLTSKTIGHLIKKPTPSPSPINGNIYKVPCLDCTRSYIGESSRPLKNRLREHRDDIRFAKTSNAIFNHINETKHRPNFKDAHSLKITHDTRKRKLIESAVILSSHTMKQRGGFYRLNSSIARHICRENHIDIPA